jgi:hypothetical protein
MTAVAENHRDSAPSSARQIHPSIRQRMTRTLGRRSSACQGAPTPDRIEPGCRTARGRGDGPRSTERGNDEREPLDRHAAPRAPARAGCHAARACVRPRAPRPGRRSAPRGSEK